MDEIKLFDAEMKFMNIIWNNAPINSTSLAKLANEELGWKKSTTYTVLRKLGKRGVLKNENATVTYLVEREEVQQSESEEFIDKVYDGSLKLFLTSFLNKEKLSESQALELKKIIDENTKKEE
ncbi:Predicted transcriptional regulator [Anaerovirgula multivorans]|uniref:Predicted transcriptional regulator n=1 Tax=Anaerovirgula multivorans TaxID=312168 RepID=A0A239HXZ1_9FIRM|nr:BlaI/MecI/CopY family transcriptional regulator [Anaerovirgula multivorans]SNS85563.1 Predicted transcriptional regulator [Anaerovirgula multivorans]